MIHVPAHVLVVAHKLIELGKKARDIASGLGHKSSHETITEIGPRAAEAHEHEWQALVEISKDSKEVRLAEIAAVEAVIGMVERLYQLAPHTFNEIALNPGLSNFGVGVLLMGLACQLFDLDKLPSRVTVEEFLRRAKGHPKGA